MILQLAHNSRHDVNHYSAGCYEHGVGERRETTIECNDAAFSQIAARMNNVP
jgi:hypothetical protein